MIETSAGVAAPAIVRNGLPWPLFVVGWLVVGLSVVSMLLPLLPASEGMRVSLVEVMGPPWVLLALPSALIVCHRAREPATRIVGVGLLAGVAGAWVTMVLMMLTSGDRGRPLVIVFAVLLLGAMVAWWRHQRRSAAPRRARAPLGSMIIFSLLLGLVMVGAMVAAVGEAAEVATLMASISCALGCALSSRTAVARIGWGSAVVGLLVTLGLVVLGIAIMDETEFLLALPLLAVIALLMWWHVRPALRQVRGG